MPKHVLHVEVVYMLLAVSLVIGRWYGWLDNPEGRYIMTSGGADLVD